MNKQNFNESSGKLQRDLQQHTKTENYCFYDTFFVLFLINILWIFICSKKCALQLHFLTTFDSTQKKKNMDFVLFFSCFSLAFGILFILFGSEKTQLTKGIEVSTAVQIAALIVGCILIFAGLFGFYSGMRNVYIRHEKHLKKQHEFEQKRRQTTMRV